MSSQNVIKVKNIEQVVRILAERIRRQYKPSRVILFGSHAQGNPGKDSDLDILVVGKTRLSLDRTYQLQNEFFREFSIPVQIIWMSNEEFLETKDIIGGIAYPASKYGRIVYAES